MKKLNIFHLKNKINPYIVFKIKFTFCKCKILLREQKATPGVPEYFCALLTDKRLLRIPVQVWSGYSFSFYKKKISKTHHKIDGTVKSGHITNFLQTRLRSFPFLPYSTHPCSNEGADYGGCALWQMQISVIALMLHTIPPDSCQLCPTYRVTGKVNLTV